MANQPHSARARAWATPSAQLNTLNQHLPHATGKELDALERQIAAIEEHLLGLPAPSFDAVRLKLSLMFWPATTEEGEDADHKRLILDDLSQLIRESQQLLRTPA